MGTVMGGEAAVPLGAVPKAATDAKAVTRTRLLAIDALRGLVMLFMLVDHVCARPSTRTERSPIPWTR